MKGWDAMIPPYIKPVFKPAVGAGAAIRNKTAYRTGAYGIWYMDTIQRSSTA